MQRRTFLVGSCVLGAGALLGGLGINLAPVKAFAADVQKAAKVKIAQISTSICCYCAVGCGLLCSTDKMTGKIINIEGDPEHPINEGSLCAKGAGIFQTTEANPHRLPRLCTALQIAQPGKKKAGTLPLSALPKILRKSAMLRL